MQATPYERLTARDTQVLEYLARGLDNNGIAAELRLSPRTVRNYVSRVYDKIGVATRVEAALWAQIHLTDPTVDRPSATDAQAGPRAGRPA
ncbi:MAG: response regulator transcription factor [Nocardioides sp.]